MATLFTLGSPSSFSSLQTHKNTNFIPFRTCLSLPFTSQLKSKRWVCLNLKAHDFVLNCVTSSDEGLAKGVVNVRRKNLAVFVSGSGSNFRALHQATLSGDIHGTFLVLVTNKLDCGGANYARENGIPVIIYPSTKGEPNDLVDALSKYKIDFILLAGYLKLIPSELIRAYPKSVLNIHPSLLPAFGGKGYYGRKVHEAVIASGARYSGPTVHFVDEHYDMGRILAQRIVPVLANDTVEELAARVLRQEHKMYAEVAAAVCEERVIWREDGVPIIQCKSNPNHYS